MALLHFRKGLNNVMAREHISLISVVCLDDASVVHTGKRAA